MSGNLDPQDRLEMLRELRDMMDTHARLWVAVILPREAHHMPHRINENVQSILDVPASVLPSGATRDYLLEAADSGQHVYAYSPIQLEQQPEHKRYNVWLAGQRFDR